MMRKWKLFVTQLGPFVDCKQYFYYFRFKVSMDIVVLNIIIYIFFPVHINVVLSVNLWLLLLLIALKKDKITLTAWLSPFWYFVTKTTILHQCCPNAQLTEATLFFKVLPNAVWEKRRYCETKERTVRKGYKNIWVSSSIF